LSCTNYNITNYSMKKIKSKLCAWVLTAGSLAISLAAANAQNLNHAPSDLVLTFQNPGGATGSTQTVTVALGNVSTVFRDGGLFTSINIASTLSSTYGATWYDTSTLWAGAVGFRGTSATATNLLDRDPGQTIYVSKARTSVGTAGSANSVIDTIPLNSGTNITSAIGQVKNQIETVGTTAQFVQATGPSFIDDNNPFSSPGVQGAAYSNISVGVQGAFGAGNLGNNVLGASGTVELALDLYRIQTRNDVTDSNGVQQFGFGAAVNSGSYLGTLTINQAGDVNFSAVPEPSTYALVALTGMLYFFVNKRRKANS
jgi:hypothetical protein